METNAATDSDGIIRVMPDRLANKIAAGEVVQRPASVAKELLENALDAGARSVQLIVKDAGSTLVQVVDDGCGMSRADAVQCFQRHATSKIQSVDDLERIRTLGFRGEALASIAAVAQVELKTRRVEDTVGTRVVVAGGEITTTEPCATPPGTSLAVRNLFYNVPARRNFLKTPATEFKHLTDTFQFIALAEPAVAFTLEHKGRPVYDLPAVTDGDFFARTRQRIADLLGAAYRERLVPVEDASSYLSARGFVSKPSFHRSSRTDQFLFVNGRYVKSRYLSHAVRAAYGELLPDGAFPFFALFLQLDPRRVDVNVHPTKAEVKFEDESGIYGFLRGAVREALGRAHVTPDFSRKETDTDQSDAHRSGRDTEPSDGPRPFRPRGRSDVASAEGNPASSPSAEGPRTSPPRRAGSSERTPGEVARVLYAGAQQTTRVTPEEKSEAGEAPEDEARSDRRPIWALHDTYLVMPTDEGVMLVDQRAAHTRVLYERLLHQTDGGHAPSQQLLFPHTVELSPSEIELFDAWKDDLLAMGFEAERLSGRTVALRGVPADARQAEDAVQLRELLEQLDAQTHDASDRRKALAARLAQRHAIPRGHALAADERRALIDDLFACEMPYADPQGRPTVLTRSLEEIARAFEQ